MKSMSQAEDFGDPKLAMKQRSQERPLWGKRSIYTHFPPPQTTQKEGWTEIQPEL